MFNKKQLAKELYQHTFDSQGFPLEPSEVVQVGFPVRLLRAISQYLEKDTKLAPVKGAELLRLTNG